MDKPASSKILELIQMGYKDQDKGAKMVHEKMRKAEYTAFSSWIKACSEDPRLRTLTVASSKKAGPSHPDEVIRHARKSRVVDAFVRQVWSHRMRCFPCHTPHEIDDDNPKHKNARKNMKKMEERHGIRFTSRLRLFRETPEKTMQHWIETSMDPEPDRLPLINLKNPTDSLLVVKPSSKIPPKKEDGTLEKPSHVHPVSHMGGLKMHKDDFSYKSIIAWIEDYARVVNGEYTSVEDLPQDNWYPSKHVVFLKEAPDSWAQLARVQVFVHPWNASANDWEEEPIAFTQGSVTPRKAVAGTLFLLRSPNYENTLDWSSDDPTLKPGKYLLKTYIDTGNKIATNPTIMLDQSDFAGSIEIQAHWNKGFPKAERHSLSLLKR